jgi:cytochrome bd ubiquinol oxidase subunit II
MQLADLPAVLALVGITAYVILGGADFGAGFWQLTPGSSTRSRSIRDHAYHAMGPVWEANHVWLIFVLVVVWTGYPVAFGSIASTLAAPLFVAGVGIILRGTAYALRSSAGAPRGQRRIELLLAVSSILTPFALGAAVGGIASGRVPVGNARGDLVASWLNPTSALVGTTAVATAAYLAAVYLAADAARVGSAELVAAFRTRAIVVGMVAGATALAGLVVLRWDAERIWNGLTHGWGLVALAASAVGGIATLVLVTRNGFGPARVSAATAVAAIVVGWAIAQRPQLLPGLTISEAAAPRATLVALLVVTGIAAIVLVPQLVLLFSLFLRGRFDWVGTQQDGSVEPTTLPSYPSSRALGPLAIAFLLVGTGLTVLTDTGWTLAVGVTCLALFIGSAFFVIVVPRGPAT